MRALKLYVLIGFIGFSIPGFTANPEISNIELFGKPAYSTAVSAGNILRVDYDYSDGDADADASYISWFRDVNGDGIFNGADTYVKQDYVPNVNSKEYTVVSGDVGSQISVRVDAIDNTAATGNTLSAGGSDATITGAYPNAGSTSDIDITSTPAQPYLNISLNTGYDLSVTGNGTIATIYGDVTTANQNIITVGAGATLIIYGKLATGTKLDIFVLSGGKLEIYSGFSAVNNAEIAITGSVKVTGDFTTNGGGSASLIINAGGSLGVTGDIAISSPTGTITNNGVVQAGGTITPLTSFTDDGGTAAQNDPTPLPIVLTYFKAFHNNNTVTLAWQTASEENNDYFTLERSADGINYEIIGTVQGAGNSMTTLNYSYTDNSPLKGVSYYRLTQTDYDGQFEVFNPVSVTNLTESEIKVSTDLVTKEFTISLGGEVGVGNIKIYNLLGVLLKDIDIDNSYMTINTSNLERGTYILMISANNKSISKKVMVQ